jgi:hypothetical protein
MRTTVRLPEDLLARAKRKAAAEGRTLTSLIEEGLRIVVANKPGSRETAKRDPLPVSSVGDGLMPGVDLTRSADVQEIMDDQTIRDAGLVKLR